MTEVSRRVVFGLLTAGLLVAAHLILRPAPIPASTGILSVRSRAESRS